MIFSVTVLLCLFYLLGYYIRKADEWDPFGPQLILHTVVLGTGLVSAIGLIIRGFQ